MSNAVAHLLCHQLIIPVKAEQHLTMAWLMCHKDAKRNLE